MNGKETIQKITAECARVLLGVVFIFSGTVKAIDPVGGAIKIDDYLVAFHLEFLKIFSIFWAYACCWEFTGDTVRF